MLDGFGGVLQLFNGPFPGSPTETLLRLLPPLNGLVLMQSLGLEYVDSLNLTYKHLVNLDCQRHDHFMHQFSFPRSY